MKYLIPALRFKIFMIILLGLIYPFMMTGVSQIIFPDQAGGQLIKKGDQIIGSKLIAQNFEKPEYFWPRPSAVNFNPLPSGGSNSSQSATSLKQAVQDRRIKLSATNPEQTLEPPQDLLFASGSGLDPHLSPEAAKYQVLRVAKVRNIAASQIDALIDQMTNGRTFGIFGERTVNVLELNLALDNLKP